MTLDRHRCATQLSFWLPGLGQLYLHRWWRGAVMLAASWITFEQAWRACSPAWTVATLAVWVVAVRDASARSVVQGSRFSNAPVSKSRRR